MSIGDLSRLRSVPDSGDVYNRLMAVLELVQNGGGGGGGPVGGSSTLYVDTGRATYNPARGDMSRPYPTIGAALNDAQPNDTIMLLSDVQESVVVPDDMAIAIVGQGREVTTWSSIDPSPPLFVGSSNVRVERLTLNSVSEPFVVSATGGTLFSIADCDVTGGTTAVVSGVQLFTAVNTGFDDLVVDNVSIGLMTMSGLTGIVRNTLTVSNGADLSIVGSGFIQNLLLSGDNNFVTVAEALLLSTTATSGNANVLEMYSTTVLSSISVAPSTCNFLANACNLLGEVNLLSEASQFNATLIYCNLPSGIDVGDNVVAVTVGSTFSPANISLGSNATVVNENNYFANVPPSVSDDSSSSYRVGSMWFDVTGEEAYVCLNASPGAAVWKQIT